MIEGGVIVVRAAAYGIRVIARRLSVTLAILTVAAGAGIVVAYPLWYLAENHTNAYTVMALTAIAAGLFVGAVKKIVSARRAVGESQKSSRVFARIVWTIGGAVVAYGAVVTAVSGRFALATVLGLVLILVPATRLGLRHGARTGDRT